ncbi:MAG: hypothetical protein DI570_04840 [Phenylobacterium zucineum]|nr:MAG: hypothetical protein DI570_04840 [Phenylobacterium zucineum]
MRLRASILAAAGLALAAVAPGAAGAATFTNGGFESGFDDWTPSNGLIFDVGEFNHRAADNSLIEHFDPREGDFLAYLQADSSGAPTLLSQTFDTRGGVFSGWGAFLGRDAAQADYGFIRIFNADLSVDITLLSTSTTQVGGYGSTPALGRTFSTLLGEGTYTLEIGVANAGDGRNPSFIVVDGFKMAEVPEPGVWALMLTGFLGVGAALRRRRTALA